MDAGLSKIGSRQVYKSGDQSKSLEQALGEALADVEQSGSNTSPSSIQSEVSLGEMTKGAVIDRFKQISPNHPLIDLAAEFSLDRPSKPEVYLRKRLANFFSDLFTDGEGYARNVLGHMSISALLDMQSYLPKAIEKAKARQEEQKAEKVESILNKVQAMAIQQGLTLEDVLGIAGDAKVKPRRKNRVHNLVRYRCEAMGRTWYWNGTSKMPIAFKVAMAEAGTRDVSKFLMPESEWVEFDADIHLSRVTPKQSAEAKKILINLGYADA